jgi:hypothetical protein
MTLDDLINETRTRTQDKVLPYLVSDEQLTVWANEADLEASEREARIYDEDSLFCTIPIIAGTSHYTIDDSIRTIEWMRRLSDDTPVLQSSGQELTQRYGSQWNQAIGKVERYVRHNSVLMVYKIPDANDTLVMGVYRRPVASELMTLANRMTCVPAVPESSHMQLVYWMLFRWYGVRDPEIMPLGDKSQEWYDRFETAFGRRRSGRYDQFNQDYPTGPALPVLAVR